MGQIFKIFLKVTVPYALLYSIGSYYLYLDNVVSWALGIAIIAAVVIFIVHAIYIFVAALLYTQTNKYIFFSLPAILIATDVFAVITNYDTFSLTTRIIEFGFDLVNLIT